MSAEFSDWNEVKDCYYSDFRSIQGELIGDADLTRMMIDQYEDSLGRHIVIDEFQRLEISMKETVRELYGDFGEANEVECPYSGVIDGKLQKYRMPDEIDMDDDTRVFLESSFPGGFEAPVLITSLLRRMGDIGTYFEAGADPADLARNSKGLLREPLNHPQQWAKAFMFTLADRDSIQSYRRIYAFERDGFLTPEMFGDHVTVVTSETGEPRVEWSRPIEEFTLNTDLPVVSRTLGSEASPTPENTVVYPEGTPLKEIIVDEDTIGCPGKAIALKLWQAGVEVAEEKQLWGRAA